MFTTVSHYLGVEDNCWSFACGIICPILYDTRQSLNSLWSPLPDSSFHDGSYIFHKTQIWTASKQAGTSLPESRNHSVVACVEWALVLFCFPGKMSSWWHFMSLYNQNIYLHVNGTFTIMQVTHILWIDEPQWQDRCLLLHLLLVKIWLVCRLPELRFLPKTSWNIDSSDHSRHFHFVLDHLRQWRNFVLKSGWDMCVNEWITWHVNKNIDPTLQHVQWQWK